MDKEQLRLELKRILAEQLDNAHRHEKSEKACRNLINSPEFQNASTIMMYLSMPQEVDTTPALLQAWRQGKKVAIPKIFWDQRFMVPVQIDSLETDFSIEIAGLRNPASQDIVDLQEIDLIVVPALGFDRQGNRLGKGAGYYDRFLANDKLHAKKAGLAFDQQVLDSIPFSQKDQKMDLLITELEVIYFSK